ncbi:hypothetical protein [Brumimicrobium mesophilum]|uniref:hypothetical protein n=1 Tax=Brumimicrobium mesophilum TaxID=392717 RepID=UPI000D144039|nr:hypothetical protein [Brumimicrobium mesophilum]
MKSFLTILLLSISLISFSQSITLKNAYILQVNETTDDIIYQGKSKSNITFLISDSTVHHTEIKRKTDEVIKDVTYTILKNEMIKRVHSITMQADEMQYVLLIPKNRRKKVALSFNKITTVISGRTKKLD